MKNLFLLCTAIVLMTACKKTNKQDEPTPIAAEKVCRISMIEGIGKYEYDGKGNLVKSYSVDSLGNVTDAEYEEFIYNEKNQLITNNSTEDKIDITSFQLSYYNDGLIKTIGQYKGLNGTGKEESIYDFFYDSTRHLKYILHFENAVKYDSTVYDNFVNDVPLTYNKFNFFNGTYSLHKEYRRSVDAIGNELKLEYFEKTISNWVRIAERTFDYSLEDYTLNLVPLEKVWNKPSRDYWVNPIKTLKYYSFDNGKEVLYGNSTIDYVINKNKQIEKMIFNSEKSATSYSLSYECK